MMELNERKFIRNNDNKDYQLLKDISNIYYLNRTNSIPGKKEKLKTKMIHPFVKLKPLPISTIGCNQRDDKIMQKHNVQLSRNIKVSNKININSSKLIEFDKFIEIMLYLARNNYLSSSDNNTGLMINLDGLKNYELNLVQGIMIYENRVLMNNLDKLRVFLNLKLSMNEFSSIWNKKAMNMCNEMNDIISMLYMQNNMKDQV